MAVFIIETVSMFYVSFLTEACSTFQLLVDISWLFLQVKNDCLRYTTR